MSNTLFPSSEFQESQAQGFGYRVLARKYRPVTFTDLVGQESAVQTLINAIQSNRLAHAYMLTGVRGVGKTTMARIIARALNCTGSGLNGPTPNPCGTCDTCKAIHQDHHVDVLEMDAASRTGVDDIREIIDGIQYAPVSCRYKVYIIDEVHMLSKNAFNALLKTLEEPPPHVKFIFATTEIQKVPVTVLSRCQRFDLRRVNTGTLAEHFVNIAKAEGVEIEQEALALIVRGADGSVRDGLSLLDQAISLSGSRVKASEVKTMLGLADRTQLLELLDALTKGNPQKALEIFEEIHSHSADSLTILRDMLDVIHGLTKLKVAPSVVEDLITSENERNYRVALANRLNIPALARAWQILLKGLSEVQTAPNPLQAAEIVIIRLAFAADLPLPGDILKKLEAQSEMVPNGEITQQEFLKPYAHTDLKRPEPQQANIMSGKGQPVSEVESTSPVSNQPGDFSALVDLFSKNREGVLYGFLYSAVHLVRFEPGVLEVRLQDSAPRDFSQKVAGCLQKWTGRPWVVVNSKEKGEPTLADQAQAMQIRIKQEAASHPLVQSVLQTFSGASITEVRRLKSVSSGIDTSTKTQDEDFSTGTPPTHLQDESDGDGML